MFHNDEAFQSSLSTHSPIFAGLSKTAAGMGGFVNELSNHAIGWLPNGGKELVVSFDNLSALRDEEAREIWGQHFLLKRGFDVLGVMIKRGDWYRDAELITALLKLRDTGFFGKYDRVSMYGSSMGGFAALAFAPLAPGCTVLAFAPQRSLDPQLVDFDQRYIKWDSWPYCGLPFSDAAEGLKAAGRAYIAFDPLVEEDRLHAAALEAPNVCLLRMTHLGHKIPPELRKMQILEQLATLALRAELDTPTFHSLLRHRRLSRPWRLGLYRRGVEAGHGGLVLKVAQAEQKRTPHWKLRHFVNDLKQERLGG